MSRLETPPPDLVAHECGLWNQEGQNCAYCKSLMQPYDVSHLVALVREWQTRYDEMVTKKHRLREQRLIEAEEALFAYPLSQD